MKRFLCIALLSWLTLDLPAATPNLLRCNARVSSGGQLFQGMGQWKAALIDGSGASLWSNDGTSANGGAPTSHFTAQVIKGQAALMLGDTGMSSLPASAFTQSGLKMRLWFNDGSHGFQQLTPDQTVQPVPMALVTAQADAPADGAVETADFASGAVTNAKLAADAVTSDKFAAGAVTSAKLAPNAVLNAGDAGYLPAGAVIMSDTEENAALTTAGFAKQGSMTSDQPAWQVPPPAFWDRRGHITTWTGTEMLVWGGVQASSGSNHGQLWKWNPTSSTWRAGSSINEPVDNELLQSQRYEFAMHAWTGSKWLVWNHSVGAAYDPSADTWTPISTVGAPSPRSQSAVAWTGSEMLIWGGLTLDGNSSASSNGFAYNPTTDTWRPISTVSAPTGRINAATVWTGTEMLVWGGRSGFTQAGGRYNPATDTWTAMTTVGGPNVDYVGSACAWTGTEMLIASGDGSGNPTPGYRYQPATNTWTAMSTVNEPSQRSDSVFAWTGTELILWGGYNFFVSGYALGDGARYNPITNTWSTISSLAAPSARFNHAGVWTGTQLIIMGGQAPYVPSVPTVVLDDASSYDPATNGWSPIVMPQSPPTAREHVATVWTGTEWIIYGGASSYSPMNGSRFNPASQTWTPLPDGGPAGRTNPSAVWTGSELLVFGGSISSVAYDDVWKWSPTTNTWTSTSPPTRPSARYSASAVWTGTEMIIYAGRAAAGTALSDGWRFNPVTNTWTVIATHPSLTARVDHFAAWTGTEMLIYGGSGVGGGFYNPVTNNWRIISYIDAVYGATVWTGTELIVWGGEGITTRNIGARYNPDTQVWTPLPLTGAPSARYGHTLVWDGQRAYVWGGDVNISDDTTKSDGAVYDPSTDAWTPLPAEGAPLARSAHYAVWTGDQLLIWGGETDIGGHSLLDDLAALKPSTSRWFYVKQ